MYPNPPRHRGGAGLGGASSAYEADQYERENEEKMSALHSRITNLKSITIAIGDEVRDQNRSLDMMQNGFGDTDNLIGSTMRKMQGMYQSHGAMSVVYLSIFCVVCFLVFAALQHKQKCCCTRHARHLSNILPQLCFRLTFTLTREQVYGLIKMGA